MITRKLLAALVGLSLATSALGTASAQTAVPTAPSVSPSDTVAPTAAVKTDTTKKAPVRKHHARIAFKTHRRDASLRPAKHVATKGDTGKQVAGKRIGMKVAHHANKRIRLSHLVKRGTSKHV